MTEQQKQQFIDKAKKAGFKDEQISSYLEAKSQQGEITAKKEDNRPVTKKIGDALGSVFGGSAIGDYIGTKIAERSPEAKRLREVSPELQDKNIFEAPTAGQIGADALNAGLTIAAPFTGGATLAARAGVQFAGKTLAKKILGGAGYGAALGGTKGYAETGDLGQAAQGAAAGATVGGAIPVAGAAIRGASKLTGRFLSATLKNSAAVLSGKNRAVIDTIADDPVNALKGMEDPRGIARSVAKEVKGLGFKLRREASQQYKSALDDLPKALGRKPVVKSAGGKTIIKVDGQNYTLSTLGAKAKLTKTLRDFGVDVNPRAKKFDFLESPFDKAEEKRLREVFDVIHSWRDSTPAGLNKLAIKVGNYRRSGVQSNELNNVIDNMKRSIREYLGDRVPQIKVMNSEFERRMNFLDELDSATSWQKGNVLEIDSKLGTLFNTHKDLAQEVVEFLEGGNVILAKQAGRQMADISRAGSAIGDFARNVISTVAPPKAVGKAVAYSAVQKQRIRAALSEIAPKVRKRELLQLLKAMGINSIADLK